MKQKVTKTLLAATLCTTMFGGTVMAATPGVLDDVAAGGSVEGNSTVENPIYKIAVPTTLEFAVDPFAQKGQSQIYSKDFFMVNKSNVPVQLDCSITLTAGTDVSIKDKKEDVKEDDNSKLIYMAAEIPSGVTPDTKAAGPYETPLKSDGSKYFEASSTPSTGTWNAADEMEDTVSVAGDYSTKSKEVGLSGSAAKKVTFALEKAAYQDYFTADDESTSAKQFKKVAADDKGVATFRFSGKVNTKATWAAAAVKAKVDYTFNGLTGDNYTKLSAEASDDAHAYVLPKEDKNVVTSDGTKDVVVYYTGDKPASVTFTPVNTTGTTKTAITKSAGAEVEIDNEKVTLKAAWLKGLIDSAGRGTGTYKLTINSVDTEITLTK